MQHITNTQNILKNGKIKWIKLVKAQMSLSQLSTKPPWEFGMETLMLISGDYSLPYFINWLMILEDSSLSRQLFNNFNLSSKILGGNQNTLLIFLSEMKLLMPQLMILIMDLLLLQYHEWCILANSMIILINNLFQRWN